MSRGRAGGGLDRAMLGVGTVVVLGAIMSILDVTVVNVAINTLARDFHTSLSTIQWVSTGYMLALASVIPLTGWAADRFGTKRLFMTSISLFLVGSALSGAAWSADSLIFFRILQGIGGGMIMPAGITMLTQAAGPARVGRVMSLVGIPMMLGPVFGPVLGGWLVDDASWRWIFYINVPIGAIVLPLALRILPRDRPEPSERLDWRGLTILSPGLAAFVYGLAETSSSGGIGAPQAILPMLAGLGLIVAFVVRARRVEGALLDVRLFGQRAVAAAAGTTVLFGMAVFGAMLLLPLYFQIVRGESALSAGLMMAPQGIGAALMMPFAGRITDRTGPGKVVLGGLVVTLVSLFSLTQVGAQTSYVLLGATLFVMGLGLGATMMPAMSAALQTLGRSQVARATSGLSIIQRVGGSIGVALVSVVLTRQLTAHLPSSGGRTGLAAAQSVPAGARGRVAPILADAFGHTFWWAFAIIVCAFVPAAFLSRRRPVAPTPETAAAAAAPAPVDAAVLVESA
jgi:EmrB/QacA subfamily drug resistance transporter